MGENDVDGRAGDTTAGQAHDLLDSGALSDLLPPCPEWPDLN
jgi:hypothetical protein